MIKTTAKELNEQMGGAVRLDKIHRGYALAAQTLEKPIVGVLLPGSNPIELFFEINQALPNFDYFVFVPGLNLHLETALQKAGVRYTGDLDTFILCSNMLDCVLTFGNLPHKSHFQPLIATSLLHAIEVPIIDIQHGLFQWGINFTDSSFHQGFSDETGISLPISTEANIQLTWAGKNAIGYPRFNGELVGDTPRKAQSPILIATNTNWHIYSPEERIRLREMIRELFVSIPEQSFYFKPHPAEFNHDTSSFAQLIEEVQTYRQQFANVELFKPMKEDSQTLTQLIKECRAGILTAGTAIIDFEMLKKPCLVFNCRSVSPLLASLERVRKCDNYINILEFIASLQDNVEYPITGQLRAFDPENLKKIMNDAIGKKRSSKASDNLGMRLSHLALARQLG